jgi:hypothetical protein
MQLVHTEVVASDPVDRSGGSTSYERGTLGVRGDVLLWVAL